MITISLNGKPHELAAECSVAELIQQTGVRAERVAVLQNEEVVPKARHGEAVVRDGDAVEIITLAGGG